MEKIVSNYLRFLNIPISQRYIEKLVVSHPDYPSILSIADVLHRLGIDHCISRVSLKEVGSVPFPYLIKIEGKRRWKLQTISSQKDLNDLVAENSNYSTSIVIQAEPTKEIDDKRNEEYLSEENFKNLVTGTLIVAMVGLLFLLNSFAVTWLLGLLLLSAIGGTLTGFLLIAKDIGITYKPVEKFCHANQNSDNCNLILQSEAAKIFEKLSLSDVAGSYFLFQLIVLGLIIPLTADGTPYYAVLSALSVLTVPVIAYSLYYQKVKAKKWCNLCLTVDGILLLELGLFGYMYIQNLAGFGDLSASITVVTNLLLVIVTGMVILVKNTVHQKNNAVEAETIANRLKYDPEVFINKLVSQKPVDDSLFDRELMIGNKETPIRILMVASLGCGICKDGFKIASKFVTKYPKQAHLAIRFRGRSKGNSDQGTPTTYLVRYWQQRIYGKPDASTRLNQAFEDWFSIPNLKAFKKEYPMSENGFNANTGDDLINLHFQWTNQANVFKTPLFFINGYKLPLQYEIGDLMLMMPGLVDQIEQNQIKYIGTESNHEIVSKKT